MRAHLRRVELPEIEAIYAKHGAANKAFFEEVHAAQGLAAGDTLRDDEEDIGSPLLLFIFNLGLPSFIERGVKISTEFSKRVRDGTIHHNR